MTREQKYTPEQVIQALRAKKGMVYLAAIELGCKAQTIYNYRDRYASVRAAMEEEDGVIDDAAEMKLYTAILAGEPWAIQFRLRTKGKGRGYSEKILTEQSGDVTINIVHKSRKREDDDGIHSPAA